MLPNPSPVQLSYDQERTHTNILSSAMTALNNLLHIYPLPDGIFNGRLLILVQLQVLRVHYGRAKGWPSAVQLGLLGMSPSVPCLGICLSALTGHWQHIRFFSPILIWGLGRDNNLNFFLLQDWVWFGLVWCHGDVLGDTESARSVHIAVIICI